MSLKENKYFDAVSSTTYKIKEEAKQVVTDIVTNTNFFSNLGTIWSQSTSAFAGITECVITPGIRFIKWVSGIMQVYKKLQYNFNTIKRRLTSITNKLNAFDTGNYEHVRQSVIKRKVNNK